MDTPPLDFSDIRRLAEGPWLDSQAPWWKVAAAHAVRKGLVHLIPTRDGQHLYLARFWLHPTPSHQGPDQVNLESGNSALLHCFARPDDDGSLHDHPWDFKTRVLSGAYLEALPPVDWDSRHGGPPINARQRMVNTGETVEHAAHDLHAVAEIYGETWTLVSTGPRMRSWGFFPPLSRWMPYPEFLGLKRV